MLCFRLPWRLAVESELWQMLLPHRWLLYLVWGQWVLQGTRQWGNTHLCPIEAGESFCLVIFYRVFFSRCVDWWLWRGSGSQVEVGEFKDPRECIKCITWSPPVSHWLDFMVGDPNQKIFHSLTPSTRYLNCPCMINCLSFSHPICRWTEDGSLVNDDDSFTNWGEGYPGGPQGQYSNCMLMFQDNGKWIDLDCGTSRSHAVCSKPIGSSAARNISRA